MLLSLNGVRAEPNQATVSVFDRGFIFGDAIYEVVRTVGRRPFHLDAHLDRLERSGAAIGLGLAPYRAELIRDIQDLVAGAPAGDLSIRIMITRGETPDLDLDTITGPPNRIIWVKPMSPFPEQLYREGVRLVGVHPAEVVPRVAPAVKSNNRLANVMAHRLARERGGHDALFVDLEGCVTEGPTWNLFAVLNGTVVTPPLDGAVLAGITRELVLECCERLGIPAQERSLRLEEARGASELFITSTTRGVMPVGRLDDVALTPTPGPLTARLHQEFAARIEEERG